MTKNISKAKTVILCISVLIVTAMTTSAYGFDQVNRSVLTRGWDIFNEPLSSGEVIWQVTGNILDVTFQLRGVRPNHTYTVGSHLFNSAPFSVDNFLGYSLGVKADQAISREGNTAFVVGYDFGKLTTDGQGNGSARFSGPVPAGNYPLQFTVRIGECFPAQGITNGCGAVYRTGGRFAEHLESIRLY